MGLNMIGLKKILLPCLLLTSCLKPPELEQDFGLESPYEDVSNALNQTPYISPHTVEQNEFVYYERWQQIETLKPELALQRAHTVTKKEDQGDHYLLTIITEIREPVNGQMKPSLSENQARLDKPTTLFQLANMFLKIQTPLSLPIVTFGEKIRPKQESTAKVTFHNLKTKNLNWKIPTLIKERPDCGGLTPTQCQDGVAAVEVSFDRVLWETRGGDKTHFIFTYSDQVPYFANQLSACMEAKLDYQGQRLNLVQCESVRDFTKGQALLGVKKWKKK